jgi:hypothetical protein
LDGKLKALTAELNDLAGGEDNLKKLRSIALNYADRTELTAEMLNQLISRIEIGYPHRVNGKIQTGNQYNL